MPPSLPKLYLHLAQWLENNTGVLDTAALHKNSGFTGSTSWKGIGPLHGPSNHSSFLPVSATTSIAWHNPYEIIRPSRFPRLIRRVQYILFSNYSASDGQQGLMTGAFQTGFRCRFQQPALTDGASLLVVFLVRESATARKFSFFAIEYLRRGKKTL